MVNGELTQSTITLVQGLGGLAILLTIFLVFWANVRKSKYEADATKEKVKKEALEAQEKAIAIAVLEAKKEKESEIAFRDLQKSINDMAVTVTCLDTNLRGDIKAIKETDLDRIKWITEIESSTKSAHRRLDEHRVVEHGLPNAQHHRANDYVLEGKEG